MQSVPVAKHSPDFQAINQAIAKLWPNIPPISYRFAHVSLVLVNAPQFWDKKSSALSPTRWIRVRHNQFHLPGNRSVTTIAPALIAPTQEIPAPQAWVLQQYLRHLA